jgi:septal ring factor EnvC (AmiA/AmiB activator)
MKRIVVMCIAGLLVASPVFAATEMSKEQKDQCLLASKEFRGEVDSIQKKMKKLEGEIKKGKKVYTAEELKKLEMKLEEANKMLDTLLAP